MAGDASDEREVREQGGRRVPMLGAGVVRVMDFGGTTLSQAHTFYAALTSRLLRRYDKFLDPLSPEYIAINPKHSGLVRATCFPEEDGENDGADWRDEDVQTLRKKLKDIANAYKTVSEELSEVLMHKYMGEYYHSKEFHEISTSVEGRTWRVLKMCKRSREICLRLETAVAVPMQKIVKESSLDHLYGGAKQFNLTMSEVSVDFQQKLLDIVERLENAAITIRALYEKSVKKKTLLSIGAGAGGGFGGEGGAEGGGEAGAAEGGQDPLGKFVSPADTARDLMLSPGTSGGGTPRGRRGTIGGGEAGTPRSASGVRAASPRRESGAGRGAGGIGNRRKSLANVVG
jgi:hypothetical protein